jgi:hypothetical protein
LAPGNKLLITGSSDFNGPQLGAPSVMHGRSGCDEFAFAVRAEKVGRIRNADNPRLTFAPSQSTGAITRHAFDDRTVNASVKDSVGLVVSRVGVNTSDHAIDSEFDDVEPDLFAPGVDEDRRVFRFSQFYSCSIANARAERCRTDGQISRCSVAPIPSNGEA